MKTYSVSTDDLKKYIEILRAGDKVLLSGTVFTARDAVHKEFFNLLNNGDDLPINIKGASIYYAGPTPTPKNLSIGSCGPTTSSRMDYYTPKLLEMGLLAMIGKGPRSKEVIDSIIKNKAIYFCAIGGAGALASKAITNASVIAFKDLGCESLKKLTLNNFPVIVGVDCFGGNLFEDN